MPTEDRTSGEARPPVRFRRHGRLLQVTDALYVDVTRVTVLGPPAAGSEGVTLWIDHRPYLLVIDAPTLIAAIADAQAGWEREGEYERELGRLTALDVQRMPPGEVPDWEQLDRPWG